MSEEHDNQQEQAVTFAEQPRRPWWSIALEVIVWLAVAAVLLLLPGWLNTGNKIAVVVCYVAAFSVAVFGAFRPRSIRRGTPLRKHIAFCALFVALLLAFIVLIVAASFFIVRFA